jgi:5'-nucleotidase
MQKKFRILITNDDGIMAPGIRHLWEALDGVAELYIVAPATEQSAVGLAITIRHPIQIQAVEWKDQTPAWKVTGTPADCVRLGMSVILDFSPDLIVSGINRGSNSGRNVLYSGTIGGIIEGTLRNIPGIAFSCVDFADPDYSKAVPFIAPLVRHILEHPLPPGTLLNVNFPDVENILGVRLARQGRGFWIEDPDKRVHPEGHDYYWLGGKWHEHEEDEESDVHLLSKGFAAAVPIHISELTDLAHFHDRKEQFNEIFSLRV